MQQCATTAAPLLLGVLIPAIVRMRSIIVVLCNQTHYAILNFIAGSQEAAQVASDSLFAEAGPSPLHTIGNVLLFLVGAIAVMTWLPGIIIGIILLSTRQKV